MKKATRILGIITLAVMIGFTMAACSVKSNPAEVVKEPEANNIVALKGTIFMDIEEVASDTPPHIVNGITMVPVRAIMEMIGYEVKWEHKKQQMEVWEPFGEQPQMVMIVGHPAAFCEIYAAEIDEYLTAEIPLDAHPVLINEKMLVPLSFIAEAIGYRADYTVDTEDIYLFSPYLIEGRKGE
ncbi:MAG: copper amine oxidase N-terminal domain-containing protein [Treponema sp.]|jgi:N-acetylmuramoyl-L-alanine amidase|nr:copper amine oxidase N-terminal domain-containing protein [Treponema sp.]